MTEDAARDGTQRPEAPGETDNAWPAPAPDQADVDKRTAVPETGWIPGKRVAVAALVALAVIIVGSMALAILGVDLEASASVIPLVVISGIAFVGGGWAAIRVRPHLPWAALGLRPTTKGWIATSAGIGLATLLLNLSGASVYSRLTGDETIPPDRMAMVDTMQGPLWQVALMFVAGALLIPFAEELMFRGVVFGWLRRWPTPVAVIVSALIFGVMHGVSIVLPIAVVLGIVTALIYHRSGSLWNAVVVHAVNNGVAFALTFAMP